MVMPIKRKCPKCDSEYMGSDCINLNDVCPACCYGGFLLGEHYIVAGVTNNGTSIMDKALKLATEKHQGQKRKNGEDYINHPMRVANRVLKMYGFDIYLYCIAILHDTVEDTDIAIEEIENKFGCETASAVQELSRKKGETYFDFIMRLKNLNAIKVKLADLDDNLSDLEESSMKDKYRFARYMLENRLNNL